MFAVLDDGRAGLGHSEAFAQRSWPYRGGAMLNFAQTEFSEVQHSPVPNAPGIGTGRGLFSTKCKHWFVKRTSMIAHIYPSVLQAVSGRDYAGCLEGCFQGYRGEDMQDPASELRRILIPRNPVNRGEEEGPGHLPRHLYRSSLAVPSACSTHAPPRRSPQRRSG